jgi:hypothetical protein
MNEITIATNRGIALWLEVQAFGLIVSGMTQEGAARRDLAVSMENTGNREH